MKLVLSLFIVFSFYSCTKKTDSPNDKNTLNLELAAALSTMDPAVCYDTICNKVLSQLYESLYEYHYLKRPYQLKPLLAEGMPQISKDGLTYKIKIKKNIAYHTDSIFKGKTRFVQAHDFINQIKRVAFLPTKSRGWWLFENKVVGLDEFRKEAGSDFNKLVSANIQGLQAPDQQTLIIKLKKPYPQLKYGLAMNFTAPMPIEAIHKHKNELHQNVYGTGPFILKNWIRQSKVEILKNTNYRQVTYPKEGDRFSNKNQLLNDAGKTIPMIDKVNFHVMKESQTAWLNFRKKKIDLMLVQKDNFTSVVTENGKLTAEMAKEGIQLKMSNSLIYWWLAFNMQHPILGKKNLRNAIAHAINWDQYISLFTNNIGQRANSIYPPGIPGYDPEAKLPYSYNIAKAKKFLEKAGYKDGKNLASLKFDVRGSSTVVRQQAEFIQKELKKIGINISVITNTFPGFLKKAHEGKLTFLADGWSLDYPDAENILGLLITQNHPPGSNTSYYSNKNVDHLYEKLVALQDGPEKFKIMKEIEKIVLNDLPWIMHHYQRQYIIHHQHLLNYRHSDIINNYIKYLRVTH